VKAAAFDYVRPRDVGEALGALKGNDAKPIAGGQSLGPMPQELAYAASKGALETFTRQLAAEVAHLGITVNAVGPGPNDTGWIDERLRAELEPRFPTGRIGRPEDAARVVAWLCSDAAGWVTGQVIHAEGGFRRG